jgi:hypothetical protein
MMSDQVTRELGKKARRLGASHAKSSGFTCVMMAGIETCAAFCHGWRI